LRKAPENITLAVREPRSEERPAQIRLGNRDRCLAIAMPGTSSFLDVGEDQKVVVNQGLAIDLAQIKDALEEVARSQ